MIKYWWHDFYRILYCYDIERFGTSETAEHASKRFLEQTHITVKHYSNSWMNRFAFLQQFLLKKIDIFTPYEFLLWLQLRVSPVVIYSSIRLS